MNPLDPKLSNARSSAESETEGLPNAWNELLLQETQVSSPGAAVKDRIHARVKARMSAEPVVAAAPGLQDFTRINSAQGWKRLNDKAEKKILFNDGHTVTWLLRLAPGGSVVPHGHDKGVEECLVMQGSVLLNGELFSEGDYQLAHEGTRHEQVLSEHGCVVMLRSPASRERELHLYAGYTSVAEPVSKAVSATTKFVRALMPERFRK
jgi:anti-sigma factor ChrR (cupin superfamily)